MTTLLVSSVGGHLTQLHRLLPRLQTIDPERLWITFESPQSRSLLADEDTIYLDYTGPRDLDKVLRHSLVAHRLLREKGRFSSVVSTGSGIALSFLPLARMRGVPCHYIESFTRSAGPSLTGRLLSGLPGISLYSQYPQWANGPWRYAGSVFDAYRAQRHDRPAKQIRKAVVTLGTMQDYSFRALLERALAVIPGEAEVLWQVGCTDVSGLPIAAHRALPANELAEAIATADVVIAHAGCGSSLSALDAGKMPVLVARRASMGENIDEHQQLLARELARRGLAVSRAVDELSVADLECAASFSVSSVRRAAAFELHRR